MPEQIVEAGKHYIIYVTRGGRCIKCRTCERISYHPDDIQNKYCGNCHEFLKEDNGRVFYKRAIKEGRVSTH